MFSVTNTTLEAVRRLIVQQTSPIEVILFILVSVAAFAVLAAGVYGIIMLLFWAAGLRHEVSLSRALFPTSRQLKTHATEYLLALTTSFVVALSLGARADLVEQIRTWDIQWTESNVERFEVAQLFPLHRVPSTLAAKAREGNTSTRTSWLIEPAIKAGRVEQARYTLRAIVSEGLGGEPQQRLTAPWRYGRWFLTRTGLGVTCVLLILVHLAWLASCRYVELRSAGQTGVGYGDAVRSILMLALCVSLLLATPQLLSDEALADGSLKTIDAYPLPPVEGGAFLTPDMLTVEFDRQRGWVAPEGAGSDPERSISELIGALAGRVIGLETRVAASDERLTELRRSLDEGLNSLASRIEPLEGLESSIGARFNGVEDRVDRLADSLIGAREEMDALREGLRELGTVHGADMRSIDERFRGTEAELERMNRTIAALAESLRLEIDTVNERIREVIDQIEQLHSDTGILIVSGSEGLSFQVRQGTNVRASGTVPGFVALDPGNYQVDVARPGAGFVASTRALSVAPPQQQRSTIDVVIQRDQATGITVLR